jgi:exosome complex RNA-binding protein Rrp42 (RNase PH superfamily)
VPTTGKEVNLNVYVDFIVVQNGRAGVLLTATDVVASVSTATSAPLIQKVLARIDAT